MGKINSFEDLEVWKNASDLGVEIYKLTSCGKIAKDFGLKDQIQRAALSISNNIAEGYEYDYNKDFIKYLRFAKGSTGEVRNIMHFLLKVNYVEQEFHDKMCVELISVSKQLKGFISYLKKYVETNKS